MNSQELILTSDNATIKSVSNTSFLGIKIDSRLDWRAHTNYVAQTIASERIEILCMIGFGDRMRTLKEVVK
ncbi:hypothetical protein NQ318_016424 [Aromia moschata]|uniref:Uncharacterized protein n=1 Tax=Aromia moschata TaxID=1265417 RepID=A0AAV8Z4U0_9CUCU|nr:hypothetical protein NQ318_016424 [Aromia moschata]